jgi:hypothetical protein
MIASVVFELELRRSLLVRYIHGIFGPEGTRRVRLSASKYLKYLNLLPKTLLIYKPTNLRTFKYAFIYIDIFKIFK